MSEKISEGIWTLVVVLMAFYVGRISINTSQENLLEVNDYQEISLVKFLSIQGDQLYFSISGPARIIWGEHFVEGDGDHVLPLGQFATPDDLKLASFAYTGNAKTSKYYPSGSYPARGTEVRYRRFFHTKLEAEQAGFVASKLVK